MSQLLDTREPLHVVESLLLKHDRVRLLFRSTFLRTPLPGSKVVLPFKFSFTRVSQDRKDYGRRNQRSGSRPLFCFLAIRLGCRLAANLMGLPKKDDNGSGKMQASE